MKLKLFKSLKNKLKINFKYMDTINDFILNEKDYTTRCIYRMVKERLITNPTLSTSQVLNNMIRERLGMINIYNKLFRDDLVLIEEKEINVISKLIGKI